MNRSDSGAGFAVWVDSQYGSAVYGVGETCGGHCWNEMAFSKRDPLYVGVKKLDVDNAWLGQCQLSSVSN
ncbi:MAG: hypothetical protein G3M70_08130 [Candidatus Nitronauta litoralis]|uniref:Uncharacterized protein n=1 Tax=Candidatus Nitronauta litoralis TaxID=2705533 RepID=A0A7T0G0H4_9BACT|nr:MAG: hypothetical protein G3M70_08130 [Candidatus Nitronauta litoralis]